MIAEVNATTPAVPTSRSRRLMAFGCGEGFGESVAMISFPTSVSFMKCSLSLQVSYGNAYARISAPSLPLTASTMNCLPSIT